jgi:hypothetical protein
MNLVQINERLKDLPEQVIRQYANGMNPEVPPYLALGELQRREMSQKQMANAQGAQQGPQPSVKEQVEQRAGLMALQQMQQQQMAQQQSMPRGPMPAPAGVPQPQQQPEVMMAARGGLARIPVRSDMFEYAGGGIIAFSGEEGSQVKNPRVINLPKGTPSDEVELIRLQNPDAIVRTEDEGSKFRDIGQAIKRGLTYSSDVEAMKERSKAPPRMASPQPDTQTYTRKSGAMPTPEAPVSDLEALAEQKRIQQAPPPAAPPATPQGGLPGALPARSPYFAQVNADLAKPIAAPTPESIIAEQRALSPEAMQEEFMKKRMEEQRQRAAGERAAFEKTRPSGLDDLIRVFGQAGQYKGLSGLAPAYTANQQQRRAEELAMEQRQNQLLTGIDKSEYDSSKELFGARTTAMKEANRSFQDRLKSRSEVLAQMAGVDQRAIDSALDRLNAAQIAKMRAIEGTTAGERVTAQYLKLKAENKPAEAEALLEAHLKITRGGEKEDTLGKEIAKKRVEAAALPEGKYKDQVLAGLAALERQQGGGGGRTPTTKAQYDALPKGASYIAPDGTTRIKG